MGLGAAFLLVLTANAAPRIGLAPFVTEGLDESQHAFYEAHLQKALLRYGIPMDSVEQTTARVGAEALRDCTEAHPAGCVAARGAYPAMVVARIVHPDGGYTGQFAVVDTSSGAVVSSQSLSSPDARSFLDGCTEVAKTLANQSATRLGLELPVDAPLRGAAVYPLVAGGILIGTGAYFLFAAASDSSTLKTHGTPLSEAVAARDNGPTHLALGITLTTLGVASTVVGIVFYAPGAERKPLARLQFDPINQRVAISGVFP